MEYRCRLGTPGGDIIEGVYVADSEARLRREFEEKGLYVLAIQQAGRRALAGVHLPAMPQRHKVAEPRVPRLQPGAGDAAQGGHAAGAVARHPAPPRHQPVFKARARRRLRTGAAGQRAVGSVRGARPLFPGVYTASLLAGEKSGNLEQVLRRYVSYVKIVSSVKRKTISALVYPAILVLLSLVVVTIIVVKVVPEFGNFYNQFGKELPLLDADDRRHVGRS